MQLQLRLHTRQDDASQAFAALDGAYEVRSRGLLDIDNDPLPILRYQTRPGSRVVTSWTNHVLSSGSLKEKKDP
jgi:hypothetical protein